MLDSKEKRKNNELLWAAVKDGTLEQCKELLNREKYGEMAAQPNARGLDDWTSLHLAANCGRADICELLLSIGGIELNARSSNQRTPLHIAVMRNHREAVEVLLNHNADINAVDSEGATPLHHASALGLSSIVKCLLNYEPDFMITNNMEKTSFDVSGTLEIVELFESYFAQRNIRINADSYSRTRLGPVFMHNSREDMIAKILYKASNRADPQALRICFERGGLQTNKFAPELAPESQSTGTESFKANGRSIEEEEARTETISYNEFSPVCVLGRGSFGEVFLVQKKDTNELFAMKILRKDRVVSQNLMRYAVTERNVLTYIKHPFIVGLKYAFQTPEKLALILDYCPGGSLGAILTSERKYPLHRFNEDRARIYCCEVLLALEELHNRGIIYRDLKPDNVVLDYQGHALLTDFGLSKEGITESIMTKSFCGSIAYLPPEMLTRHGHTQTVDFYLFGVMLFEMLTGTPPYYSSARTELYHNILHQKLKLPKKLSPSVRELMTGLLDRDPATRLGAGGVKEIKDQSWFQGIDWDAVYRRELHPIPVPERRRKIPHTPLTMVKIFSSGGKAGPTVNGWSFIGSSS